MADLPELPELDNLFSPVGVIQEAQTLAAAAFGAERTWFLTNGSTCGIEAAILTVCCPGDQIIVPRNAHRSVVSGLILAGAIPVFVSPDYSLELGLMLGVTPDTIAAALHHYPDVRAVLLVSPTYHGLCSDLAAIAQLTHSQQIPLLVDEAHGPHFSFHPELPTPALAAGADLVVQSTHKVLSALSQASMLHCQGPRIDAERLQAALQLTQSTSPSYLLLASLDAARHQMATAGKALMEKTLALSREIRSKVSIIPGLEVIGPTQLAACPSVHEMDLTRLTIDVSGLGLTGLAADEILHNVLGITAELPELRHLTFIISLGNTSEDGNRCLDGLAALGNIAAAETGGLRQYPYLVADRLYPDASRDHSNRFNVPQISPRDAFFAPTETIPRADVVGRVSADTLSAYPPGIPAIVNGEVITADTIAYLTAIVEQGGYVTGGSDASLQTFRVIDL